YSNNTVGDQVNNGTYYAVVNGSSDPFGPGASIAGVDSLLIGTTGILRIFGSGGAEYWQAPTSGNVYTPSGYELGGLVKNLDGSYTYTSPNQVKYNFTSTGQLSSIVDPHGLAVTYNYSGSQLGNVLEPDGGLTTLNYSAGLLAGINEPGNRMVSLSRAGSQLTITMPDGNSRALNFDSISRLVNDRWGPTNVTIAYDSTN